MRSALPLREGELFSPEDESSDNLKQDIRTAITHAIGREPTDVAVVCCDHRGNWMIYIGLPAPRTRTSPTTRRRRATSDFRLTFLKLRDEMDEAMIAAVMPGKAGEDDSRGFALSSDPALRAKQMDLRRYALSNEATLLGVLEASSDARHRAVAAQALAYARTSNRQISALVRACLDPDDGVRNDAARALAVLAGATRDVTRWIPAGVFIRLLSSGIWSDHNKAVWVLDRLTRRRNAAVLKQLREVSLDSLLEMARWRSRDHSASALTIVGRIAGIEEKRLQRLIEQGNADEIIDAASASRSNR